MRLQGDHHTRDCPRNGTRLTVLEVYADDPEGRKPPATGNLTAHSLRRGTNVPAVWKLCKVRCETCKLVSVDWHLQPDRGNLEP